MTSFGRQWPLSSLVLLIPSPRSRKSVFSSYTSEYPIFSFLSLIIRHIHFVFFSFSCCCLFIFLTYACEFEFHSYLSLSPSVWMNLSFIHVITKLRQSSVPFLENAIFYLSTATHFSYKKDMYTYIILTEFMNIFFSSTDSIIVQTVFCCCFTPSISPSVYFTFHLRVFYFFSSLLFERGGKWNASGNIWKGL